jgi:hypothetical protein
MRHAAFDVSATFELAGLEQHSSGLMISVLTTIKYLVGQNEGGLGHVGERPTF